jgi:lipopolysaccharide transport system ATP-binding protein
VEINGRVGSLLEVGTGFHEELTGRENVYLNAAILGMKKLETKRRFDEIVSFAEIEKFIDTPVKHYSSGMHVRLAFAVAAHLDPEILLVDEVLAVGDLGFQQRAIERMSFLMTQGITVIFVSHNLPMVRRFCKWGFLLENGAIKASGEIEHVINTYKRVFVENVQAHTAQQGLVKVQTVRLLDAHNRIPQAEFDCGGEMLVEIVLSSSELLRGVHFHIAFRSTELNRYCVASTAFDSITIGEIKGSITIEARVKGLNFPPGIYQTEVFISNLSHTYDYASYKTEPFEILPRPGVDERLGAYLIPAKWEVKRG